MTDNERVKFSIGVLIIGSLCWDLKRKPWRDSRLKMEDVRDVRVRIRYGRCSESRDNTYTMVFSSNAGEGQAKVVRCRHDIVKPADLDAEADHLWAAERNVKPDGSIASDWGCVALLCNPDSKIPVDLTAAWAKRVASIPGYDKIPYEPGEKEQVSGEGLLQIAWPYISGSNAPVPLDLLIATANHPTLAGKPKSYQAPEVIAAGWRSEKAVKKNRVEYFRNNVTNGIRTFEDEAISALLKDLNDGSNV